jgi:P4 family phage/plasmid primase-like protien
MSVDRDRVAEAFDAAIDYWHRQLDQPIAEHADVDGDDEHDKADRPNTAREYFEEVRGYDRETVDAWRLGWAPPDGGLYDELRRKGFDADTIAATGLFCNEDDDVEEGRSNRELWHGRYIFPYFAADGTAEYAIARCTGSKGGGAADYDGHNADFIAGKYAKVAHTRENVPLEEPILGLHTLPDAEQVVIAEGIADAISATEAGYAVLSPVTKEFKREHFDAVVQAVDEHDIDRVYVVPDAEPAQFSEIDSDDVPEEPDHIHEVITQPAVAPGPGGGLRTANHLVEHGIDARLVELPRPSFEKVDLDEFIQKWDQGLAPAEIDEVLAKIDDNAPQADIGRDDIREAADGFGLGDVLRAAKPPAEHPKFDAATATQNTDGEVTATSGNVSGTLSTDVTGEVTPVTSAESASALFDLDVGDVNPELTDGYRGKNPLGHTGDSENYFAVYEIGGDLFAKDYKRPGRPTYNGVTYLLVDDGERPVDEPNGPLSPRETWAAWREARERGLLTADDPIPTAALEGVARERELYDFETFDAATDADDPELPPKAWNRALNYVNSIWAEESDVDLTDDDDATSKSYRSKTATPARTWEDVRYIYSESKEEGRRAARELLSERYEFMTVEETDDLLIYDPETGVYVDETGDIHGEIYDGLRTYWSTYEKNEILAGLRQKNIVPKRRQNGQALEGPHICVENGVLDLLNRELKDHEPEYYFVDRVPVEYDPDAETSPHADFVGGLVERDAEKRTLFEMVGHALMPDANERYKKFLILTGDADNGKSAFYSRVKALLDGPNREEKNTSAVKLAKMAQNRFSIHSIYGSLANIAGEIDGKKIRNTAAIKDIPGGDPIELEPKGGESYFDTVNTTLMFAANDPPIIGERDKEAIASRIVPVELPFTFVDDPGGEYEKEAVDKAELEDRLDTAEARSGLLNLALDGIERLEANGGDVSLPEEPEERLRDYERSADPMREFGERCLTNDAGDYVVKADVTTIYKEFAVAEGYEVGSNIGSVLHDVLRGVASLNYTESRKRTPDYSTTSLPLRSWDERKRVVDRVTLTEEGLQHAEAAGLTVDQRDDAGSAGQNPGLADLEPGRHTVDVTIAEELEAKPWQQGRGHAVDDDGNIMKYVAEGSANPLNAADEGDRVRITDAKIATDRDGVKQLEISGVCDVDVLPRAEGDQASVADAATDGGPEKAASGDGGDDQSADGSAEGDRDQAAAEPDQQLKKTVREALEEDYGPGADVTAAGLAAGLMKAGEDAPPDDVAAALDVLATEGRRVERLEEGYRRL